ncbi:hypothetical protein L7F22_057628 [Adiantum nelumboides]|nr:hypothetical protein [Adiantum nelumboides]
MKTSASSVESKGTLIALAFKEMLATNEQPRASMIEAPKEDVHCKASQTLSQSVSYLQGGEEDIMAVSMKDIDPAFQNVGNKQMDGYKEEGSSSQDRQSNPTVHEVGEGSSQAEEGFPHAAFSITGTSSPGTLFGGMQSMVPNPMYANIGLHPGFQGTQGQFGVSQGNLGMAGFSIPPVNMTPRHQHVTGQGVQMAPTGVSIMHTISFDNLESMDKPKSYDRGTEIWKIHHSRPVGIPKSEHKKISSRNCYIVLQTCALKSGVLRHEIFYWLGKHAMEDDIVGAAIKAIALDAALGGRAVVYREAEGFETDKFLSYFKPCFMPLDERHLHDNEGRRQICLFKCNGRHVAHVKEVPFRRASLSHEDVFILDTEFKIFQFNGANTDIYHRAKALDVVQYLRENVHEKDCSVAVIEDGKFVADADSGEFWSFFGGFAPLGRRSNADLHSTGKSTQASLLCLREGQVHKVEEFNLRRELLSTNKCYILDCGTELFTWVGRDTTLEERRATALAVEKLIGKHDNSVEAHAICTIEGFEPREFKIKFESWPIDSSAPISENGRGKVAVLLKHKGFNVKGLLKAAPVKESASLINNNGKLQVWCVNGSAKFSVPASSHGKFFNSNCYIVLHTFPGERRDDYIVYTWAGHESNLETRTSAAEFVTELTSSLKGAVEVHNS